MLRPAEHVFAARHLAVADMARPRICDRLLRDIVGVAPKQPLAEGDPGDPRHRMRASAKTRLAPEKADPVAQVAKPAPEEEVGRPGVGPGVRGRMLARVKPAARAFASDPST